MNQFQRIVCPDDWHCHLREGKMLTFMVESLLRQGFRGRVLVMPNTKNPILTARDAAEYHGQILVEIDKSLSSYRFQPVMTIQITPTTSARTIREAFAQGIKIGKVYPRLVTTNSELGVANYRDIYPVLAEAEKLGFIVCFHGEHPSKDIEGLDKEMRFLEIASQIRRDFPGLKMTLEHISTAQAVAWVKKQPVDLVFATITPQHLLYVLDDVLGYNPEEGFSPHADIHLICKPTLKRLIDRLALQNVVLRGDPHFGYGSDCAIHTLKAKCDGACGVLNVFASIPLWLGWLATKGLSHQQLQDFMSGFGADFYGYPRLKETIRVKTDEAGWDMPRSIVVPGLDEVVVPLGAGRHFMHEVVGG